MSPLERIIGAIEEHSVEEISACFAEGLNPNELYNGVQLIYELTSEYARGPRFRECVRAFVDNGLDFHDPILLSVLLNDEEQLDQLIKENQSDLSKKYSIKCAYTPLLEAPLLHICAEFNHVKCAKILVKYGADINERAGIDENGFGGQTAIFHTVNQNQHRSEEMLEYLLGLSADLQLTVKGLIWGEGYPWETFIPSVNPLSYAMMGLLPQMHRNEKTISSVVSKLLKKAYGIDYTSNNIPNAYLK